MSHPHQGPGAYQTPVPYGQPGTANSEGLFQIGLLKHTGAVIFWQQQTVRYTGTLQQCEQAYRDAQTHCLLLGWWSVGSLFVLNWIALFSNMGAIRKVRNLAANPQASQPAWPQQPPGQQPLAQQPPAQQPPGIPPAWYPDPSGQPGQRFWDGTNWTHWTNPPGHR